MLQRTTHEKNDIACWIHMLNGEHNILLPPQAERNEAEESQAGVKI